MDRQLKPIYLVQMNHFDPIWRRCWDRRFEYEGRIFASYADLQEAIISDWIRTADRGKTTFVLEQAVSLRKYIERHPEHYGTLRRLARERRIEILAGGEVIPDANMPMGESLVRNLLYGILWAEKTLGIPVNIGCRNDGFGSSAQIPQMFRQCEIRWLPFLSYKTPAGNYWRGLDGSTLYVRPPQARLLLGTNVKLAPCNACKGKGCEACQDRGFDQNGHVEVSSWLEDTGSEPFGLISLGGEETLPCMDLEKQVAERAENAEGVEYRFGIYQDLLPHVAAELEAVDNPPPERVALDPDIALSSAGCWVTRIKLKQRNRRAEHALLAAETLAAWAWLRGEQYPTDLLADTWRSLVFTHFHDAITATHIDAAYAELMNLYDWLDADTQAFTARAAHAITKRCTVEGQDRPATVFNTLSWSRTAPVSVEIAGWPTQWATVCDDLGPLPVYGIDRRADDTAVIHTLGRDVPALGSRGIRLSPATRAPAVESLAGESIENDCFRITSDEHGIVSITDKSTGDELIKPEALYAGELILEHDYGDPWATRRADHHRERLSPLTRRSAVRRVAGGCEIILEGQHPGNPTDFEVVWLTWRQRVLLRDGLPYVEFVTEVDWDTYNRRIRIGFPTAARGDHGDYEIPYGTIRRGRYEPTYEANGVNGDWPAIHWAAPAGNNTRVAIINRGECSYRIEDGTVLVSLLRSPGSPWCLHEPQFYRMPLFDGMRDAGKHEFRLAMFPFKGPWQDSGVTQQAWSYNAPLPAVADCTPAVPSMGLGLSAKGTMISTVKRAEDGDALIVRLYEYAGQGETTALHIPEGFSKAQLVNLLERQPSPLPVNDHSVQIEMKPFKLVTVRVEK